jgi:hypothetical protein
MSCFLGFELFPPPQLVRYKLNASGIDCSDWWTTTTTTEIVEPVVSSKDATTRALDPILHSRTHDNTTATTTTIHVSEKALVDEKQEDHGNESHEEDKEEEKEEEDDPIATDEVPNKEAMVPPAVIFTMAGDDCEDVVCGKDDLVVSATTPTTVHTTLPAKDDDTRTRQTRMDEKLQWATTHSLTIPPPVGPPPPRERTIHRTHAPTSSIIHDKPTSDSTTAAVPPPPRFPISPPIGTTMIQTATTSGAMVTADTSISDNKNDTVLAPKEVGVVFPQSSFYDNVTPDTKIIMTLSQWVDLYHAELVHQDLENVPIYLLVILPLLLLATSPDLVKTLVKAMVSR